MEIVTIKGINIYPFTSTEELLCYVDGKKTLLVALNAGKIDRSSEEVRNIINSGIGYCDGIGALLAIRKKGYKDASKILGNELWLDIINKYHKDKTFYLVGGRQEVLLKVVEKLRVEFKDINIVGFENGYFTDEEKLINDILIKKPDIVFVAMGSPKQELLMDRLYKKHKALYQGLGGSFDVYSGEVKNMPEWTIKYNVNGLYRVATRLRNKNVLKRLLLDTWYMIRLVLGKVK